MSATDARPIETTRSRYDQADDADLVVRAKRDRAAFEPLYLRYADLVYRYCYRRVGDADGAADATSQVFMKAIAALSSCRPESFRSWLFAIAHNVITDWMRARRPISALDDVSEQVTGEPGPEELAVVADERSRLRAVLYQLPTDQRNVLELRLAGLSTVEIAGALGRSRGAIDTAQCRAVQRLRTLLGAGPGTNGEPR